MPRRHDGCQFSDPTLIARLTGSIGRSVRVAGSLQGFGRASRLKLLDGSKEVSNALADAHRAIQFARRAGETTREVSPA
jgi:hypothetical protein